MSDLGVTELQEQKPHQYSILRENKKPEWKDEWNLSEYITLTDGLIGKLDGSIKLTNEKAYRNGKEVQEDLVPPTEVVYLDKSARPVAWLVRALWDQLAEKRNGEIPKRLNTFFLNIDKEDWLRKMQVPQKHLQDPPPELIDYEKIDKEHYARIRALFSKEKMTEAEVEKAWEYPTWFDGKHVMIVDEVKSSGATLEIAQNLLSRAFPEATISGQYWVKPTRVILNGGAPDKEGRLQFNVGWMPAWYSSISELGRGVGNKDPRWPEIAESRGVSPPESAKIGRYVLSTPLRNPKTNDEIADPRAEKLYQEFHYLAEDLKKKDILYRPSADRLVTGDRDSQARFISRLERVNGMSFQDWRARRDVIAPVRT